ncbi:phosphotriesterase-related protein isoform X2 [Periplaneta americana]
MTHEHLSMDYQKLFIAPPKQLKHFFENKITLENFGFIKQYPYSSNFNCILNDAETHAAVLYDVQLYKQFGGGTIVENSNHGLQRNVQFLKEVSQKTGVHIIAGTGHYVSFVQSSSALAVSQEDMHKLMVQEVTTGCVDQPDVKCGFIGEVGSGWPLHDFEIRAIKATGEVQAELGCPVSFHPGRHPEAPFEIIRLFQEAGGDVKKTVMSHLDRTLTKNEDLLEFSNLGTYCQFDLFGIECSLYQMHLTTDMPSDAQRIDKISSLIEAGKEDKILVAHDIHTKHRLIQFGGHGYSHILNTVLPQMLTKGISQEITDKITIENPKTWLSYKSRQ